MASHSFGAFTTLSKESIFMINALRWIPESFATWMFESGQRPGMARLLENREYVHEVAAKSIEERQALKDGAPRMDLLSLLG